MTILVYIVVILCTAAVTALSYLKWTYGYWKRRNVLYIEPTIPLGNFGKALFEKRGLFSTIRDAHEQFKARGGRFGGIFLLHKPIFIPVHTDLIKSILTKDFHHFANRLSVVNEEIDPISTNVFSAEDEKWRNLRTKLNPTFTSVKMKFMFDTITNCCRQMIDHIESSCVRGQPLQLKEITACYATDVIGCCVYGLDCNSFKNPDAAFRKYGRKINELTLSVAFKQFLFFVMPELNNLLRMRLFDTEAADFFSAAFREVFESRKTEENGDRKDFVRLLLDIGRTNGEPSSRSLTMNEMVAQAIVFFLAGSESSASNLAFSLYELAMHQDVQDRLRREVLQILDRYEGRLTYECLSEMNYMDQVIDETLRLFPPLPFLTRTCTMDYVVPGCDLKLEKGSSVMISVLGLHMDADHFPDPENYDPDRFTKENVAKRPQYAHIPFGEGPRICIGQRFAILQIKIGLSMILKQFKVLPHPSTPKSLSFDGRRVTIVIEDDILLQAKSL